MWGTMFLVNDPVDKRRIHALLHPVTDEEDDLSGCQEVGQTGISAFDIDGQLVLGINGAGYEQLPENLSRKGFVPIRGAPHSVT